LFVLCLFSGFVCFASYFACPVFLYCVVYRFSPCIKLFIFFNSGKWPTWRTISSITCLFEHCIFCRPKAIQPNVSRQFINCNDYVILNCNDYANLFHVSRQFTNCNDFVILNCNDYANLFHVSRQFINCNDYVILNCNDYANLFHVSGQSINCNDYVNITSTWRNTFTTTQNIELNLPHLNNFTKILSLIVKVLWTMRLRCVLAILVILDHSSVFRVIIPEVVLAF